MPFGQAAAVGAMPPKKSNEEQRLAGKQKLEAFKRQKAEAAAAKAAGKNTGIVEISEPSNAVEVPEPVLVRSEISLLISSLAGSKPSALRATLSSLTSMVPEPLASRSSKASWTSSC